jgi:hypothetical protein
MLTARKLLISQAAEKAKRATKPNPLYVYCTVSFCANQTQIREILNERMERDAAWLWFAFGRSFISSELFFY